MRNIEDIRALLKAGADKVSIMTAAVQERAFVRRAAEQFGTQCIVVAIDAKRIPAGKAMEEGAPPCWEVYTHGGRHATGIDVCAYAEEVVALGAGELLVTSMDRDGTQQGFDLALIRKIADSVSVPVIASGGVGNLSHLIEGIREGHAAAVLAASIFHFGLYSLAEAKEALAQAGLPVRRAPPYAPEIWPHPPLA